MLKIIYTTQFKKDYKLAQKRGVDVEELFKVIELLQKQKPLPSEKKITFYMETIKAIGNVMSVRTCS